MITPDSSERFFRVVSERANSSSLTSRDFTRRAQPLQAAMPVVPERALAAGVLRQAVADLRRYRHAKDAIGREICGDARSWFESNDPDWPYSFVNTCAVLGLAHEEVRAEAFADAESTWYAHSRRVAVRVVLSVGTSLRTILNMRRGHSLASANS